MRKTSDLELRKIKRLHRKGYSILAIAKELNRSKSFVCSKIREIDNSKKKLR